MDETGITACYANYQATLEKTYSFPLCALILILASAVDVVMDEDKENKVPVTPKKRAAFTKSKSFGGSPSPLSPSKRGINANAPESPTKRLQTSMKALMVQPPPKMQAVAAKRNA